MDMCSGRFRPLQTEREKVIKMATERYEVDAGIAGLTTHECMELMYDAGMLKLPD